MSLTDIALRNLKPADTAFRVPDRDGLYVLVHPNGRKVWRYDYRTKAKRGTAYLGRYPDVGLGAARAALAETKARLAAGQPMTVRDALVGPRDTFAEVGEDYLTWLRGKVPALSERTIDKKVWIIEDIAGPVLGDSKMRDIKPGDVLTVLRSLEAKGQLETAKRTRSTVSAMFRYAAWNGKADHDPVAPLRGAVASPVHEHHAAITDEKAFGDLLSNVQDYSGWYAVRLSVLFIAFTFCRPGEARLAQWSEFDMDGKVWTIPVERMKMRREHKVPLSSQALGILEQARRIDPNSPLVFPSVRSNRKPLSDNALNAALRRMGYTKQEMVAHGFRSSASTILNERGFDADIVEVQLSHMSADRIKRIYDRGERWDQRVKLMKDWGRICESLMLA